MRCIGMPESRLTTGLVPMAKISAPLRVKCSQNRAAAATIIQSRMMVEMPKAWLEPSQFSVALSTEMALPPAMSTSTPCSIVAIASVMISGGRPR